MIVVVQHAQSLQDGLEDWRPREEFQLESKAFCWQNSSAGEVSLFSIKVFNDWRRSSHITKSNLLILKSTDFIVNCIWKNTFTETFRIMFDQMSGYRDLAKLTHKINHH